MTEDNLNQIPDEQPQATPQPGGNQKQGHTFADDGIAAIKAVAGARGTFASGMTMPAAAGGTTTRASKPLLDDAAPVVEYREVDRDYEIVRLIVVAFLLIPVLIFSYFPTVAEIVSIWYRVQDYSHGFLIVPLVIYFLWIRFDTYPGTYKGLDWLGLIPLLFSFVARYFGSLQYMDAVEQWSIFFWIIGVIWLFYGSRTFFWALPSLSFLLFMFPLPYRFEVASRQKLQLVAAEFAAYILQILGQPAINYKTTIRMGAHEIGVEAACSGIRFLISFFAIAFGTILLMRRPWWQNIVILIAVVPIAIFVNACRIAMTSLMIMYCSNMLEPWTKKNQSVGVLADEISGYIAIGLAFTVFALFILYLTRVFRKVNMLGS